jgi:hypothetical protein
LSVLQNPEPEKPAWFDSMGPSQVAGAVSASYRVGAAWAGPGENMAALPVSSSAAAATVVIRRRRR